MPLRLSLLLLTSVLLPAAWGWCIHWLVERYWPVRKSPEQSRSDSQPRTPPLDFQI